jgi:hypothetical protein
MTPNTVRTAVGLHAHLHRPVYSEDTEVEVGSPPKDVMSLKCSCVLSVHLH